MGEDDELDPVADAELGEDPRHVRLDGSLPDPQGQRYLGVGVAPGDLEEDLVLAWGELRQSPDGPG